MHCVSRRHITLQIGTKHEYTVRCQTCCLSRAKWRHCCRFWALHGLRVVFRLVRSWLFCSSGFWWRLFVARLWSVLLSVVSGREILCGPLERWGAGRLFHRGIRIQAAAASCEHVSCSGGREPVAWARMPLTGHRLFWSFQNKRAPPVGRH